MRIFLIVLLSSLGALAANKGARIIGGRDARAGEFPFVAGFYLQTPLGRFFCQGSLLNQQWILSSASCVDGVTEFDIVLGTLKLDGPDALKVSADEYLIHPDYNPLTLENDIGLIRLRLPVTYTDYVQPVALSERVLNPYAIVTTVGWGQTSDDDPAFAENLQAVQITAISNSECGTYFNNAITDNMVCVDGNYNEGTCIGDTGSPLIQYVNVHTPTIIGVCSFISINGCESTDPSGFTRVQPYLDWITTNINA